MNVVIYARFSSSSQREESIEGQVRVCQKYAEENGYTVINTYSDRAISGKTDSRPALQKMLADSSKKQFQAVLVYSLDRFGRNLMQSVINECKLEKNDVKLLSATEKFEDNAAGNLQRNILKSFAQYYSEELSEKVIRGMDLNAEKCLSTGGNVALGFRVGEDKKFYIDEEEALIVRYIFESYANGMTVKEITDNLNAQGRRTSRGAKFNKNSLRTLLQNKRYIGIYTYKGKEIPDGMPRIISDELFYKVAEILEKNRKAPARTKADVEYLLTLKLFCGHCKEMMTGLSGTGKMGKTYRYYECKGRKNKSCNKKRVRKEYIEDLVVEVCRQQLTDKNIRKISKELMAIANTSAESHRISGLKKQIKEHERKHNNLLNNVAECDIPSVCQSIFVKIEEIENIIKRLEESLENEMKNQVVLSEPQIRFFLNSLKKGDTSDIKYRKALITLFVNSIYLYDDKMTIVFNSGDGPVTVDDLLLSEIEEHFQQTEEGLFLERVSPPKNTRSFGKILRCCVLFIAWGYTPYNTIEKPKKILYYTNQKAFLNTTFKNAFLCPVSCAACCHADASKLSHFPKVIYRHIPSNVLSSRCHPTVFSCGSNAVSPVLAGNAIVDVVRASWQRSCRSDRCVVRKQLGLALVKLYLLALLPGGLRGLCGGRSGCRCTFPEAVQPGVPDGVRIVHVAVIHVHIAGNAVDFARAGFLPDAVLSGIGALCAVLRHPHGISFQKIAFKILQEIRAGIQPHPVTGLLYDFQKRPCNCSAGGFSQGKLLFLFNVVVDGKLKRFPFQHLQANRRFLPRFCFICGIAVPVGTYRHAVGLASGIVVFKLHVFLGNFFPVAGADDGEFYPVRLDMRPVDIPVVFADIDTLHTHSSFPLVCNSSIAFVKIPGSGMPSSPAFSVMEISSFTTNAMHTASRIYVVPSVMSRRAATRTSSRETHFFASPLHPILLDSLPVSDFGDLPQAATASPVI